MSWGDGKEKVALISVTDKVGLDALAVCLMQNGWKILASGGTALYISELGIPVIEVSSYTGADEMLGGRVKTLQQKIYAGILARDTTEDMEELSEKGFSAIRMVVVNLYGFSEMVASGGSDIECIESIDIGGVGILRAAAKNYDSVLCVSSPRQYEEVMGYITSNSVSISERKRYAGQCFAQIAKYDVDIAEYFGYFRFDVSENGGVPLKYGENPHQSARLVVDSDSNMPLGCNLLAGPSLSYNNVLDINAALNLLNEFTQQCAVVVKHNSPCGVAVGNSIVDTVTNAIECDAVSAYGGIVGVNGTIDLEVAKLLSKKFLEVVVATKYTSDGLRYLESNKSKTKILEIGLDFNKYVNSSEIRSVRHGMLIQTVDNYDAWNELRCVTKIKPTKEELNDLKIAWLTAKHVKSNAIVLAKNNMTVGIGGGQPSRVRSVQIAGQNAGSRGVGSCMASDAFFPFADGVIEAYKAGVRSVVQPGGSIRDNDVIQTADEHGMSMILVPSRHFKH